MLERDAVKTERIKTPKGRVYTISIFPDLNPTDPRDYDNIGYMACHHRRYHLGDEQLKSREDIHTWEQVKYMLIKERKAEVILPLYLYDHGGLAISVIPWQGRAPHADWDSGQVGYIYATREKILHEYDAQRITPRIRDTVHKCLVAEVESYDKYLRGEVYGYQVTDSKGEIVHSCWGYDDIDAAIEAAKEVAL